MKMAKANENDLQVAHELCSAFESFRYSRFPTSMDQDADDDERFDEDDPEDCKRAMAYLLELSQRGSLFRVVFGMVVVLDPRNKIVDPDSDVLELHPDTVAALAAVKSTP